MRRLLIRSAAFIRAARRIVKRSPGAAEGLRAALEQLAEDAFHPSLRTHKLKGDLHGLWACQEAILLQTVGTHDEVY